MTEQDAGQAGSKQTASGQGAGFNLTPAEVRERWVAALRSGKYRRGTGQLCERGGRGHRRKYCCLGVLCDVVVRAGLSVEVEVAAEGVIYDGESGTLPAVVMEAAGLATNSGELADPMVGREGDEEFSLDSLVDLNDEAGWPFRKIADLIERGGVRTTDGQATGQAGEGSRTTS